jgi:hypothetical protein
MINHVWSILCQHIVTDKETNVVSYLIAIEEISIPISPTVVQIYLGTLWERIGGDEEEKLAFRLSLARPQAKAAEQIIEEELAIEGVRRQRLNFQLQLKLTLPGTYSLLLEQRTNVRWKKVSRTPLVVNVSGAETGSTPVEVAQTIEP